MKIKTWTKEIITNLWKCDRLENIAFLMFSVAAYIVFGCSVESHMIRLMLSVAFFSIIKAIREGVKSFSPVNRSVELFFWILFIVSSLIVVFYFLPIQIGLAISMICLGAFLLCWSNFDSENASLKTIEKI